MPDTIQPRDLQRRIDLDDPEESVPRREALFAFPRQQVQEGLPGLAGFVGEFLILFGAFRWNVSAAGSERRPVRNLASTLR